MFRKSYKLGFILIALLLFVSLVGCSNDSANQSEGTNSEQPEEASSGSTKGGTLNVAIGSEPDSLDWMYISSTATRDVAWHIFENLFSLDSNFEVKPMIAKDYSLSEDGVVYTINLREGVNFHDGSTVSAEDVVASIERWSNVSSVGSITSEYIDSVEAVDELTVEVKLKEVYHAFLSDMAAPKSSLMIIPAEVAEEAGDQPLKDEHLIGTGPYQFDKWDKGKEIVLSRFDQYSSRTEEDWGGLTGKKVANFDKLNFKIVKDPQVMINGLQTGLYDYVQNIPADLYETIEANPDMEPVTYMNGYHILSMDKTEAPFDDLKVRQALNYAIDKEEIAQGTYGNEEFYGLDGALFTPEQGELYSDKGTDNYLVHNKEEAKKLLEESDYDGEVLQIMYSNDTVEYEKIALITKQHMEEVGFNVELIPYEWATYLEQWMDPKNWDIVVIGWSTRFSPSELGMLELNAARSGWYDSDHWASLLDQWGVAETSEEKQQLLAEMNQTIDEDLPFLKVANVKRFDIRSTKVQDHIDWVGPHFWNAWKSE